MTRRAAPLPGHLAGPLDRRAGRDPAAWLDGRDRPGARGGPAGAGATSRSVPVASRTRKRATMERGDRGPGGAAAARAGTIAAPCPACRSNTVTRPAPIRLAFTLPGGHGAAMAGATATPWLAFPARPPRLDLARWSASGWILLRDEGEDAALAAGGILGGSQAGVRIAYRLGEGVALSGRAYLPLRRDVGRRGRGGVRLAPDPGAARQPARRTAAAARPGWPLCLRAHRFMAASAGR